MSQSALSTEENELPSIHFARNGHHIELESELDEPVLNLFKNRRISRESRVNRSPRMIKQGTSLLPANGLQVPNAGLIDALRLIASSTNRALEGQCLSPPISPLPVPQHADQLGYPSLLRFIHEHHRGQIKVSRNFDIAILLANICAAYPDAKIRILVSTHQESRKLDSKLRPLLPRQIIESHNYRYFQTAEEAQNWPFEDLPKITLSGFLTCASLDFATSDIVILADGYDATKHEAQCALGQTDATFRLFGICRERNRQPPTPHEMKVINSVFGFEMIDLLPNYRIRRPTSVALVPVGSRRNRDRSSQQTIDNPNCFIFNNFRNKRIAQLSRALVSGSNLETLPYRDLVRWRRSQIVTRHSVTILVSHLEHAVQLSRKLEGWPIYLDPSQYSFRGLPGSVRTRLRAHPGFRTAMNQIVLVDFAQKFRGYLSDVIVWAGGGDTPIIQNHWLYQRDEPAKRPLLIVDFLDGFSEQTARWANSRRQCFRQQDIYHVDEIPVHQRILKFLGAAK